MTYYITYHIEANNYSIFTDSYSWSDWWTSLESAFLGMQAPLLHKQTAFLTKADEILSEPYLQVLLKTTELPTTYADFCDQYPELFI